MIRRIKRRIKRIFERTPYRCVKVSDIVIPEEFKVTKPGHKKMKNKWFFYRKTGFLQSPILLNKEFVLVDGYTSYRICVEEGIHKVDVIFV